jgi:hypothetical protein
VKVGAENRTKLIVAVVAALVAVVLMATQFSGIFGGASANEPTSASTRMPSASELSNQPARPAVRGPRGRAATSRSIGGTKTSAVPSLDPTLHTDLLKGSEDSKYEGTGRNIFRVFVEIPQPKAPVAKGPEAPQAPQAYVPPPLPPSNLKFYGFATNRPDGAKRIFLTKNEDVFIAAEGDIVDRRYKVVRISPNSVEILDVLSNNRESIPLNAG